MNIPEEAQSAAEAAVNGWFNRANHPALDIIGDFEVYEIVEAALSAAAPTLMAMAWDEARDAYREDVSKGDVWRRNPYRKEAL